MAETPLPHATPEEMYKIRDLISQMEVAMLVTTDAGGRMRGRPMGALLDEEADAIWLFITAASTTPDEIRHQPQVGLGFADPRGDRYLFISGRAQCVEDPERVRRLWRPEFGKWFPGGPADKTLTLVRVPIAQAEYWDDSAKLMRGFFETVAAPFSGVPPEATGEHARVRP